MKKEAIIDLIKGDLNEIGTLVETFREPDRIAKEFLDLLRQKCDGVEKEIALLNYWSAENIPGVPTSDLVARVTGTESAEIGRNHATATPAASKPDISAPARRQEVPDYFSAELEQMPDPLSDKSDDGLASEEASEAEPATPQEAAPTAIAKTEPKVVQKAETKVEPAAPAKAEPVKVESAKPVAAKAPVKVASAQDVKPAPQPQSHSQASAADIATYGTPVNDVTKAIGINDRFLYQRELFNGNKAAFDSAIETINSAANFNQAHVYLQQAFGWDESEPTVEAFLKAVHRRFL